MVGAGGGQAGRRATRILYPDRVGTTLITPTAAPVQYGGDGVGLGACGDSCWVPRAVMHSFVHSSTNCQSVVLNGCARSD